MSDDDETTDPYEYFPELARGDSCSAVYTAQSLLSRHGFAVTRDGYFSDVMESVVKHFQMAKNLTPSGVIEHETWRILRALADTDPAPPPAAELGD